MNNETETAETAPKGPPMMCECCGRRVAVYAVTIPQTTNRGIVRRLCEPCAVWA